MLMVLWGQQAGGRWVMEESRHRAWMGGFFSSPEFPRHPKSQPESCWKLPPELPLASHLHGAAEGQSCPFSHILGWCLLSSTKANRRVSFWNALP